MNELSYLRELAKKYAEFAFSPRVRAIPELYRRLNSLKTVRPPVLIFEQPWGEFEDCEELRLVCTDPHFREIERRIKRTLYQAEHFPVDYTVPPYWRVSPVIDSTPLGIECSEQTIGADTGTEILSHGYKDVLSDFEALDRIKLPTLSLNESAIQREMNAANDVFEQIMPVKLGGAQLYMATWDQLPRYHGVENCLLDLYERPDFAHAMVEKYTQIHERTMDEYERLNILETDPYYLHCTPACTYELPVKDRNNEKIICKDVWGRAMAQLFGSVSPAMTDEFDLQYTKRLFDRCGLSYYGCCEPLDRKIDVLSKRFANLRRISVTPWADPDIAAEAISGRYVLSAKNNPAFVAAAQFDPEPVIAETERILKACVRTNTPCEFVLKDVSTVSNHPGNFTLWANTVNSVIDKYFA